MRLTPSVPGEVMESPSVCWRVLHAVWHRSIWHGADCERPFSHRHDFTSAHTSPHVWQILQTDKSGDDDVAQPQLSGQIDWQGFTNPKWTQWWTLFERVVLWSCLKLVPYWPTELSEARETGSVPRVQTEQLLLCLQSSEDMMQPCWDWYALPSGLLLSQTWEFLKVWKEVQKRVTWLFFADWNTNKVLQSFLV